MGLCDETSELGDWFDMSDWQWPDWPTVRFQLISHLERPADYFRQLSIRRHFKWLLRWYSNTPSGSNWHTGCPIGVLALRIFTVLLSNDADRCIQLRDARVGLELMHYPWAEVVASGYPIFHMLGRLAEETRRISFPLENACDDLGGGSGSEGFRLELVDSLLHGERLPDARLEPHLAASPSGSCPFSRAAALFTLAAAGAARVAGSAGGGAQAEGRAVAVPSQLPEDSREALDQGQELLRGWRPLGHCLYDLITTRWPIWRSLERVSAPFGVAQSERRRRHFNVELLFCGHGWSGLHSAASSYADAKGWYLHFLRADAEACPAFYASLGPALPDDTVLIQLSPWLWRWDDGLEEALATAVAIVADDADIDIVGFPSVGTDLMWDLNLRRIQLQDWALRYAEYPTGYAFTRGDRCFACESTSATRVFRTARLWKSLFATQRLGKKAQKVGSGSAWVVDADLRSRAMGLRSFTCMTPAVHEGSYLAEAQLTPKLSRSYNVEIAQFVAPSVSTRCFQSHDWSLVRKGHHDAQNLGVPRCLERDAQLALAIAANLWADSGHGRFLAARPGSSTAAMLLTHGATLLQPGAVPSDPAPLELHACCSSARGPLGQCPFPRMDELGGLPPDLLIAAGDTLVFHSARANATVLRLLPCDSGGREPVVPGVSAFVHLTNVAHPEIRILPVPLPRPNSRFRSFKVAVFYCAANDDLADSVRTFAERLGWFPYIAVVGVRDCLRFLQTSTRRMPEDALAVLISPLLWAFDAASSVGDALAAGAAQAAERGVGSVIGFPAVSRDGEWAWRVRHIRNQYWKLLYSLPRGLSFQRGHLLGPEGRLSTGRCAAGNAGSATKVFGAGFTLRELLAVVQDDPDNEVNWLVDLDLQTYEAGLLFVSCLSEPIPEEDYLPLASLSNHLSVKYEVEVAEVLGVRQERCLMGANWFEVMQKGLVAPWCFRRDVVKAFKDVHDWWTDLSPGRNFVVPEEGSFLALFRNGASGMMPWDSDFDVKLYTENTLTVPDFMNMTEGPSFQRLEIEAYAYKGCGQDSYVLLRRPNITHHIGDAYVRGQQKVSSHPWRARLFGVEVRLSPEHLEHIFFVRYRTPVRKLFGDGVPLQCYIPGHRSCMPDCRDEQSPCEFEDNFVHVDDFPLRNEPVLFPL